MENDAPRQIKSTRTGMAYYWEDTYYSNDQTVAHYVYTTSHHYRVVVRPDQIGPGQRFEIYAR